MSKPENFLARFRSYSYHHIIIACDNEASASFIRNSKNVNVFRQIGSSQELFIEDETQDLKRIDKNQVETTDDKTQVGSYVVILNGMIDTAFVVRDVEWMTSTAASTDKHDRFTSMESKGTMTVEEPRGMRFMNAVNGASDLLQSDPTGVIFMLKTIFVGHGVDGTGNEFTEHLADLTPLEFYIYGITGTFDNTGGVYTITFAGVNNGAARFPQYSRVAQQISFRPEDETDLSVNTSMQTLAKWMRHQSEKNHGCVIEALKKTYSDVAASEFEQFRKVDYQIIMESPYTKPDILRNSTISNPLYIIDGMTEGEKDKVNTSGPFKFGPKSTVEQAIRHIMDRCSRVKKDRTEGDGELGIKYSWKIHSEITMLGKGTLHPITELQTNEDIVLVVYRIRRFAEITNQVMRTVLEQPPGSQTNAGFNNEVTPDIIRENLIEFDYFFTGANTDIIDFDVKMEQGLAHLQTITTTNNIGTGVNQIVGQFPENVRIMVPTENAARSPDVSSEDKPVTPLLIRKKTPIFPATNINNTREKNIRGALDATVYSSMLTKHASLESVNIKATIHGNPYLMSQSNRRDSERERRTTGADETRVLQHWDYLPAIAKINIFMPSANDTPSSQSTFDRQRFWYDGFYYISRIDHKFDSGQFTQELHMNALLNESLILDKQTTDITQCGVEGKGSKGSKDSSQKPSSSSAKIEPTGIESFQGSSRDRLNRQDEEGLR